MIQRRDRHGKPREVDRHGEERGAWALLHSSQQGKPHALERRSARPREKVRT